MKAKADSFPLTVKAGSTAVKIYRDSKPSGDYFRVVYHLGGKRHRLNFHDLDEARAEARTKAAQLARGRGGGSTNRQKPAGLRACARCGERVRDSAGRGGD